MISIEKTSEGHDFSSTLVGDFLTTCLKKMFVKVAISPNMRSEKSQDV